MTIARTVVEHLQRNQVTYDVIPHPHTGCSKETANAAHVPPERIAKAVVLGDDGGFLMAVVPGNRYVEVKRLSKKLGRDLHLIPEERLAPVFRDCAPGAIPPLGPVYGMETILDDGLVGLPEVYFEAGDHEELVRVDGEQFVRLLKEARHGSISH
jgi:Ala-tRNA(Pro) deacylase